MTTKSYQQVEQDKPNELTDLLQRLVKSRSYYSEILNRANEVGHRLNDTNIPESSMAKEAPMGAKGLISDLQMEITRIDQLNDNFEALVNKISRLI